MKAKSQKNLAPSRRDPANNNLTGRIPASLRNLSSLTLLSVGDNNLEGSIPEELGRTTIERIQLGINRLTGTIPSSLYNLSNMRDIELGANNLEGSLSLDIGVAFHHLSQLVLPENRFTGPVPSSLFNASMLEGTFLPKTSFTGLVPPNMGRLRNLQTINMALNQLGSVGGDDLSFINSLVNCTQLQRKAFSHNFLKGPLDSTIANFTTQLGYESPHR